MQKSADSQSRPHSLLHMGSVGIQNVMQDVHMIQHGYMTGRAGDYLAASEDDLHNIFIETEQNLLNYFEEKGL